MDYDSTCYTGNLLIVTPILKFTGVQKLVTMLPDTSDSETYVTSLVHCKPLLGTVTKIFESRSLSLKIYENLVT